MLYHHIELIYTNTEKDCKQATLSIKKIRRKESNAPCQMAELVLNNYIILKAPLYSAVTPSFAFSHSSDEQM